jgi:hypothetical protein
MNEWQDIKNAHLCQHLLLDTYLLSYNQVHVINYGKRFKIACKMLLCAQKINLAAKQILVYGLSHKTIYGI